MGLEIRMGLVLLLFYGQTANRMRIDGSVASMASMIGFGSLFVVYFFLRRKFAEQWSLLDRKWPGSLTAGIIAHLSVSITVAFIADYGNAKWSWTEGELERLNGIASETQTRAKEAFKQVNEVTDPDSRAKIEEALAVLKNARARFVESGEAYDDVKKYFAGHRENLPDRGRQVHEEVFEMRGETFAALNAAVFKRYDALLTYRLDNYDALQNNAKGPVRQDDLLYSSHETALEEYNQAYVRHTSFVKKFVADHPVMAEAIGSSR